MLNISVAKFLPVVVIVLSATLAGRLPSSAETVVLTANCTSEGALLTKSLMSSGASVPLISL